MEHGNGVTVAERFKTF